MILDILLRLAYCLILGVSAPIRLLPNASLPATLTAGIATSGTYIKAIDFIFPFSTFFTIFLLVLGIEAGILIYKLIMWVIRKIPTIN